MTDKDNQTISSELTPICWHTGLVNAWDNCLPLMPEASHTPGIFGVCCRWRQVSEIGVDVHLWLGA